jgi:hypothetical protein
MGLAPHTRWEISRQGACTERTGTAKRSDIFSTASMSWLADSPHTINSTPS